MAFATVCLSTSVASAAYFVERCGATKIKSLTLRGACKKQPDKHVVKCKKKCLKRKFLKCVKYKWVQQSTSVCGLGSAGNKNQLTIKSCSATQTDTVIKAYSRAKRKTNQAVRKIEKVKASKKYKGRDKRQIHRAARWMKGIQKKLNKKIVVTCQPSTKGLCKKGPNAHTFPIFGSGMRVCPGFFSSNKLEYQAAVIVHEMAHKMGANDMLYFSQSNTGPEASPKNKSKLFGWSTIADSYEYFARFGFCVPGHTCPK